MDIRGKTIQNGEPTPENPVEIENKTNILLAIEILKKVPNIKIVKINTPLQEIPTIIEEESVYLKHFYDSLTLFRDIDLNKNIKM